MEAKHRMGRTTPTLIALIAAVAATPGAGAQIARPTVAVMQFADRGSYGAAREDLEALGVGLQQLFIDELALNANLQVMERSRIGQRASRNDAVRPLDVPTAAQIGADAGASYVVLGGFVDLYGDFRIDLTVVSTATGEVVTSARTLQRRDSLYQMVVRLANDIPRDLNLPRVSRRVMTERQGRAIPAEAVLLYTRGLLHADRGETARARDLLGQAKLLFPDYEEVDRALRQLPRR
jgi:TolB-like protein